MWYNLDLNKWAVLQLPTRWRKPKMIAFLSGLIYPFKALFDTFLIHRNEDIFFLEHNAQVCYLRKALNDYFDKPERRIYIGNGSKYSREYIYTTGEKKPKHLGVRYLRNREDYADTGVDYIVYVPIYIVTNREIELVAFINKFNVATRKYKIESI